LKDNIKMERKETILNICISFERLSEVLQWRFCRTLKEHSGVKKGW